MAAAICQPVHIFRFLFGLPLCISFRFIRGRLLACPLDGVIATLCGRLLLVGVGVRSRDDEMDGRRPRPFRTLVQPSSLFEPDASGETSAAACPDFKYADLTLSAA